MSAGLFHWRRLSRHAWLVVGNGANSVVVADGRDVLLVDTKELGFGRALRRDVEQVVGRPVTRVVSTHHHTDHAMGNAAFTADVPVVAQRRARSRTIARVARAIGEAVSEAEAGRDPFAAHEADLRDWVLYHGHVRLDEDVRAEYHEFVENGRTALRGLSNENTRLESLARLAEPHAPTELFDDTLELRVGATTVELHHWGPGHTDGDVVLVVPSDGLVVAADLVYVDLHPFIDVASGARTDEWRRRIDDLLATCDRLERSGGDALVVPGHGEPAGRGAVLRQREYFDRLHEAAARGRRAGLTRAELASAALAGLPAQRAQLLPVNLGIVFDELG